MNWQFCRCIGGGGGGSTIAARGGLPVKTYYRAYTLGKQQQTIILLC